MRRGSRSTLRCVASEVGAEAVAPRRPMVTSEGEQPQRCDPDVWEQPIDPAPLGYGDAAPSAPAVGFFFATFLSSSRRRGLCRRALCPPCRESPALRAAAGGGAEVV